MARTLKAQVPTLLYKKRGKFNAVRLNAANQDDKSILQPQAISILMRLAPPLRLRKPMNEEPQRNCSYSPRRPRLQASISLCTNSDHDCSSAYLPKNITI